MSCPSSCVQPCPFRSGRGWTLATRSVAGREKAANMCWLPADDTLSAGAFRQFVPFRISYQVFKEGHDTEKGWTNEDMANLMDAMDALTDLPWFPPSVGDGRAFRVDQWSDFTDRVKRQGMAK